MNAETIKEIIKTISQELAVPTKELLSAVYELHKADAISTISISAIVFIIGIMIFIWGFFCLKSERDEIAWPGIVLVGIATIMLIFSFMDFIVAIKKLIVFVNAPQGAAIKAVLEMIRAK